MDPRPNDEDGFCEDCRSDHDPIAEHFIRRFVREDKEFH